MTVIAVATAGRIHIVESIIQKSLPAAEAILAGAPVRLDTTTGRFTNANGTTAPEARIFGIAQRTVAAGEGLTAIRKGTLDGYTLDALAFDASVFLSDTDGRLDTAAGTVSTVVGRVVPGTANRISVGHDKLLFVDL